MVSGTDQSSQKKGENGKKPVGKKCQSRRNNKTNNKKLKQNKKILGNVKSKEGWGVLTQNFKDMGPKLQKSGKFKRKTHLK
jgi:hypothetical protein